MTYRVRTSLLGRCILQASSPAGWRDVAEHQIPFATFEVLSRDEYEALRQRVNTADKRAQAQRKSRAERLAKLPAGLADDPLWQT